MQETKNTYQYVFQNAAHSLLIVHEDDYGSSPSIV